MPFNSENASEYGKLGGRKGYEFEQEQLDKMRGILDKDLEIVKKIQEQEEISPQDEKRLNILQARISKYMDKLHVSKTATDITSGGEPIPILVKFVNGKDDTDTEGVQETIQ